MEWYLSYVFSAFMLKPLQSSPVTTSKGKPRQSFFFIPLPAGLVEIKQREYRPRCRRAGISFRGQSGQTAAVHSEMNYCLQ